MSGLPLACKLPLQPSAEALLSSPLDTLVFTCNEVPGYIPNFGFLSWTGMHGCEWVGVNIHAVLTAAHHPLTQLSSRGHCTEPWISSLTHVPPFPTHMQPGFYRAVPSK